MNDDNYEKLPLHTLERLQRMNELRGIQNSPQLNEAVANKRRERMLKEQIEVLPSDKLDDILLDALQLLTDEDTSYSRVFIPEHPTRIALIAGIKAIKLVQRLLDNGGLKR